MLLNTYTIEQHNNLINIKAYNEVMGTSNHSQYIGYDIDEALNAFIDEFNTNEESGED